MKIAHHRCVRVRFDPEFLKNEEERREEKKVRDHRGVFAFRGCKCGLSSLPFVFGFTEAVENGGGPEQRP